MWYVLILQVGGSEDPCSILYHGSMPGSELEVQAITSYIQSNAPIYAAIDFHSYSQVILFPPGIATVIAVFLSTGCLANQCWL